MSRRKRKTPKPLFLYTIILILTLALIALGALTFFSMARLAALQSTVDEMQKTVQDIYQSSASLMQKAQELESLENQEAAPESTDEQTQTSQEEGMLSPSQDSAFTDNTDESMNQLLSQINGFLPQNNGTWSVYVYNLSNHTEGNLNNQPMQAASLIKLYIMGAVYENYQQLSQQYGADSINSNLNSMITVSDNDAANTLVNWLGGGDSTNGMEKVNQFCQAHGYASTSMGRLLLQSNENGDNYTSVNDCGKFLREVYQLSSGTGDGSLTNAPEMYSLLKMQTRTNKIPAQMPDGVHVANKTGELSNVENDAGIIYDTANGVDLVICFMSQGLNDTAAAQASIAENSRRIYDYYHE